MDAPRGEVSPTPSTDCPTRRSSLSSCASTSPSRMRSYQDSSRPRTPQTSIQRNVFCGGSGSDGGGDERESTQGFQGIDSVPRGSLPIEIAHRSMVTSQDPTAILSTTTSPAHVSSHTSTPLTSKGVGMLNDVFKCIICLSHLRGAHLCPHCSKMSCAHCAQRWLGVHKSCPHCRNDVTFDQMINCRWADDVTERLGDLEKSFAHDSEEPSPDTCREHDKKMTIFCHNCSICICYHCAIWSKRHSAHTFVDLDEVYEQHVENIRSHLQELRTRKKKLLLLAQGVDRNAESIRKHYESVSEELVQIRDQTRQDLDSQLKGKLQIVLEKKNSLSTQTRELENVLLAVDEQLQSSSHTELVQNSGDLVKLMMRTRIREKVIEDVSPDFNTIGVHSHLRVKDVRGEAKVSLRSLTEGFSNLATPIYSDSVQDSGNVWRVKVYSNGSQGGQDRFMSVFLELVDGAPRSAYSTDPKYEWRIELVQPLTSSVAVAPRIPMERVACREYECGFETGECWGYERFYELQNLYDDGFVDEDDMISIRFGVRAVSFAQKSELQQWWIEVLEHERKTLRGKPPQPKDAVFADSLKLLLTKPVAITPTQRAFVPTTMTKTPPLPLTPTPTLTLTTMKSTEEQSHRSPFVFRKTKLARARVDVDVDTHIPHIPIVMHRDTLSQDESSSINNSNNHSNNSSTGNRNSNNNKDDHVDNNNHNNNHNNNNHNNNNNQNINNNDDDVQDSNRINIPNIPNAINHDNINADNGVGNTNTNTTNNNNNHNTTNNTTNINSNSNNTNNSNTDYNNNTTTNTNNNSSNSNNYNDDGTIPTDQLTQTLEVLDLQKSLASPLQHKRDWLSLSKFENLSTTSVNGRGVTPPRRQINYTNTNTTANTNTNTNVNANTNTNANANSYTNNYTNDNTINTNTNANTNDNTNNTNTNGNSTNANTNDQNTNTNNQSTIAGLVVYDGLNIKPRQAHHAHDSSSSQAPHMSSPTTLTPTLAPITATAIEMTLRHQHQHDHQHPLQHQHEHQHPHQHQHQHQHEHQHPHQHQYHSNQKFD